jgi:hypothetical protein
MCGLYPLTYDRAQWRRLVNAGVNLPSPTSGGEYAFINFSVRTLLLSVSYSFIHQWLYSPLFGPDRNRFYTGGRIPWTGDQPVTRPQPIHRKTQTKNKQTQRHSFLEWDSNSRSQCLRGRGQFMP